MIIKYGIDIPTEDIVKNIDRLTNQIFKLLPNREEGGDWEAPLENIILELGGMSRLIDSSPIFFSILCKLEILMTLRTEEDFYSFRKIIFECLGLMNSLKKDIINQGG